MDADVVRLVILKKITHLLLFCQQKNDFLNILQCFIKCFPLAVASSKNRTLYSIESVFIFFNHQR